MRNRPFKALKNGVLFALVAGIYAFLNSLPLNLARGLGAGLGRLFFVLVPYERKKTLRQLELAFPEKAPEERRAIASGVFAHLGRGGAEFMRFPRLSMPELERWVGECSGLEQMAACVRSGRGAIPVTAHVGHWELLAAYTAARLPVAVVARQLYDERLNARLNAFRRGKGITVFERNTSVKPILKWLKEGKVLGVLCDQDTGVDSVFVDFFGRQAKTPSGAAWLAQATGAGIFTAFSARRPDGLYRLRYDSEIPVPPRGEDFTGVVQEYTRRTEEFIREVPEQWAWNHNRWRTKPPQS
jgi:KDO2-lipid IV(A) lauroyltransferase